MTNTYSSLIDVGLVRRHHAAVEALPFISFKILIRDARVPVFCADYRMSSRPESKVDDVARQRDDAVGREVVCPRANIDIMYGDLAIWRGRRRIVDGASGTGDIVSESY